MSDGGPKHDQQIGIFGHCLERLLRIDSKNRRFIRTDQEDEPVLRQIRG